MLMIEKQTDIKLLSHLGANLSTLRSIFFWGLLTTALGAFVGLIVGGLVAWIQIQFGVIKMGQGSFIVESYPLILKASDFALVLFIVLAIGSLTSLIPLQQIRKV